MWNLNGILVVLTVLILGTLWPFVSSEKSVVSVLDEKTKEHKIVWHWENRFERDEVAKVKSWLAQVYQHTQTAIGSYPFTIHFYIYRSKSGNEPVPWANTTRGKIQGVHFHINPEFSLQEFLDDWTAPHEISHLSIPFVGRENSWFSEGYATYMQVQIMETQGVYSVQEANEKYEKKFAKCKLDYNTTLPMTVAVDSLKKKWNYPAMYWGGASFFWKLNRELMTKRDVSLLDVMHEYEQCCRVDESTPKEICAVFDKISHSNIAGNLLIQYQTQPAKVVFEEF